MLTDYYYKVGGLTFRLTLPDSLEVDKLLPSFLPFRSEKDDSLLFSMTVNDTRHDHNVDDYKLLDESDNDMGHLRLYKGSMGYRVELSYISTAFTHTMQCDGLFSTAQADIDFDDCYAGQILNSLLRTTYSQAVLRYEGLSVHASTIVFQGQAFLFMGKSGTGKSTHARQWLSAFPGSQLLNDDNPIVRIIDGIPIVYGSPWSGKTPCYRNLQYPIAGIVRLEQAPCNVFEEKTDIEAFTIILPGCSFVRQDAALSGMAYDTLIALANIVSVGRLRCLPNEEAAITCRKSLKHKDLIKF